MGPLDHITTWIFDLDHTLYPPSAALFAQIEARMTRRIAADLGITSAEAEALRDRAWEVHGSTLAGLMAEHAIDPAPWLADTHDIDLGGLRPDPALNAAIAALPGRRIVHTNGPSAYAASVLAAIGLSGAFDAVWGVDLTDHHTKPHPAAYDIVARAEGYAPATTAMIEDTAANLTIPHDRGLTTILVGPGPKPAHVDHITLDLAGFLSQAVSSGAVASI